MIDPNNIFCAIMLQLLFTFCFCCFSIALSVSSSKSVQLPRYHVGLNTKIVHESFRRLQRIRHPRPADIQREYTTERVNYFYDKIMRYRRETDEQSLSKFPVPFFNAIHIAQHRGEFHVIDGQHRYFAYDRFFSESGIDFNLLYVLYECSSSEQLQRYFADLNNNFDMGVGIILDEAKQQAAMKLKNHIRYKYKPHISNSMKPRFPNVHLDVVVDYFIINPSPEVKRRIRLDDNLIADFENFNRHLGRDLSLQQPDLHTKAVDKCGLFVAYKIQESLKNMRSNQRISQETRSEVWQQYEAMTENHSFLKGNFCYCCQQREINSFNFECGHRVSLARGGKTQLSNLRPLCLVCIRAMGTSDLDAFVKQFRSIPE